MAIKHADPGTIVDLNTFRPNTTSALVKEDRFETILMFIEAGKTITEHAVDGPVIVQCLSGKCEFDIEGKRLDLTPGAWFHIKGGAKHSIKSKEDTSLLVTIIFVDGSA